MHTKLLFTDPYDPSKTITEYPSFISVQGGDGTLLTAINNYYDLKKPYYGIAGGTVNFLMNSSPKVSPNATLLEFPILKAVVNLGLDTIRTVYAFNDFNIGNHNAWTEFICKHKDNQLGNFKGSGIIISTAAGSTGLNKNNGGPVMELNSSNWVITSSQANRQVKAIVRPTELTIDCLTRGTTILAADGTNEILTDVKSVTITHGGSVQLIINNLKELQLKRQ